MKREAREAHKRIAAMFFRAVCLVLVGLFFLMESAAFLRVAVNAMVVALVVTLIVGAVSGILIDGEAAVRAGVVGRDGTPDLDACYHAGRDSMRGRSPSKSGPVLQAHGEAAMLRLNNGQRESIASARGCNPRCGLIVDRIA